MKKYVFTLCIVITVLTAIQGNAQEPMNINYLCYPPFSWEENGQMKGIFIDVLNEAIGNRLGIELTHTEYPWKRAQILVRNGKADAFVTVPTDERKVYTEVSQNPVVPVNVTLFTSKDHPQLEQIKTIRTIPDLQPYNLLDYHGNGWAEKNLRGMNITWASDIDAVLKMLALRRGDLFVQVSQVTLFTIKKLGLQDKVVEIPNSLTTTTFNLCVGKTSPYIELLPEFDQTLARMKEDGTLQQIYDKYR